MATSPISPAAQMELFGKSASSAKNDAMNVLYDIVASWFGGDFNLKYHDLP